MAKRLLLLLLVSLAALSGRRGRGAGLPAGAAVDEPDIRAKSGPDRARAVPDRTPAAVLRLSLRTRLGCTGRAACSPAGKGAGAVMSERGDRRVVAPNITPDVETGAGRWTDDMLARAIREGIGHDGRALYWGMWYQSFAGLSDEDLAAVVVYLRTPAAGAQCAAADRAARRRAGSQRQESAADYSAGRWARSRATRRRLAAT